MATPKTIKLAVIEQVTNTIKNNNISSKWVTSTLCKTLGIKPQRGKRIPMSRTELLKAVENKMSFIFNSVVANYTTKELKTFITNGGSDDIKTFISSIPFTRIEGQPTEEEELNNINLMLHKLEEEQLWEFLASCTKWNAKEYYSKNTSTKSKSEKKTSKYISIPGREALQIAASYYTSLASGNGPVTPECFRKGGIKNPSHGLQRFLYTFHNADTCKQPFSINESVYNWWKENKGSEMFNGDEAINAINDGYAKQKTIIDGWKTRPHVIAAVGKKVEVTNTNTTEQATTDTSGDMDDFMAELEAEMKKEQA